MGFRFAENEALLHGVTQSMIDKNEQDNNYINTDKCFVFTEPLKADKEGIAASHLIQLTPIVHDIDEDLPKSLVLK